MNTYVGGGIGCTHHVEVIPNLLANAATSARTIEGGRAVRSSTMRRAAGLHLTASVPSSQARSSSRQAETRSPLA